MSFSYSLILCLISPIILSEGCIPTIPPEDVVIIDVTMSPEERSTLDYCATCDYKDISPLPLDTASELPSQTKEGLDADYCKTMYMRCYRTVNTVCASVKLYGVTDSGSVQLEYGSNNEAYATIVCDKQGDWTYEGEVVTRVFCVFDSCF